MSFIVVIPARYASTRFPGKPLIDIGGKPMVVRVAERAALSSATRVVIATDDARIALACSGAALSVAMTRADHPTGTDRLSEVATQLALPDDAIVVNVQGDEPLIPVSAIERVAVLLAETPKAAMATLCHPIHDVNDAMNPNVVKCVLDEGGLALYFSRAPIPWQRDRFARDRVGPPAAGAFRHIGIYAYRAGFLRTFARLPPGKLEVLEALEQLRVLEAGYRIAVAMTPVPFPPGVDTEADLLRAQVLAEQRE